MARPLSKPLSKKEQASVLSMFKGTKQREGTKNARVIAETLSVPRSRVMMYLNDQGLTNYSKSSY